MELATLILPEDVILDLSVPSKTALLGRLAAHAAARLGTGEAAVRAALMAREELGSTGIGGRVAIPHASAEGLAAPFAALAVLRKAVDYDAVDGLPVDIVFMLLVPPGGAGEHLKLLSAFARRARDERVLERLRAAAAPDEARRAVAGSEP